MRPLPGYEDADPYGVLEWLHLQQARHARHDTLAKFVEHAWRLIESREYKHNWHIDAICEHLEAVNKGEIRALIIMCPPRHSKSLLTTVFWPAWTWLREDLPIGGQRTSFAFASWSATLSVDHNLTLRRLVDMPWYREATGPGFMIDARVSRADDFRLAANGRAMATSVNSTITGFGFDVRVADDPSAIHTIDSAADRLTVKRWYDEVWKSRVDDPRRSAEVIIMQRAHPDDLVGHVLGGARAAEFTVLCLPAEYEPDHPYVYKKDPREPGEMLDKNRFGAEGYATIAPGTAFARAAQMQQRPQPRGGSIFRHARWEIADDWPKDIALARYWDMAATPEGVASDPDYTAGVLLGIDRDGIGWIINIRRGRWGAAEVERQVRLAAEMDGVSVPIWIEQEPGSAGRNLISYYQRNILRGFACRPDPATGKSLVAIQPFVAAAEAGNIRLVRGRWIDDFITECEGYSGDGSTHDDQVIAAGKGWNKVAMPVGLVTVGEM